MPKNIAVGDSVLSFEEQSGKLSYQRVSSRYEKYRDTLVVVYAMGTFIETTNDHPFFVSGEWLRAHQLKMGMSLTLASGETTIIEKVELKLQRTLVYNFTVENNHTYTVGNHKFLVHNCGPAQSGDVVQYGKKTPGLENHHGILDVWAKTNIPNYVSRAFDNVTIALTKQQHDATKAVYREWLKARTGKAVGGVVDWTKVTPKEVRDLAEKMFDAAGVTKDARQNFYKEFNKYIYSKK